MTEDEWRMHLHRRQNSDIPVELLIGCDVRHHFDPPSSGDLVDDAINKITNGPSCPYCNWFNPIDTVSLHRAAAETVRDVLINAQQAKRRTT
jgi:hypothetical protein